MGQCDGEAHAGVEAGSTGQPLPTILPGWPVRSSCRLGGLPPCAVLEGWPPTSAAVPQCDPDTAPRLSLSPKQDNSSSQHQEF